MSKVLLLCPEPLGHHNPAGVGIRFLEFARALSNAGHDVVVLSPDGGSVQRCRSDVASAATIEQYTAGCDVAVVQGHISNELFRYGAPIPVVVDLYDPFIVENLHYYDTLGAKVFQHDHETLMRSLQNGDFFLCASAGQRLFYLGALLATGRLNPISFADDPTLRRMLALVPFGVPEPRQAPQKPLDDPAVLFGGIYDWYDPIIAIDAIAQVRQQIPGITLTFTHHPNIETTPQSKFVEAMRYAESRGFRDFIRSESWVPYSQRAAFYDRFTLSLVTFRTSIETDLAMRTRIFDYFWAGIPVISSSAPGTDEIIARYGAGKVVRTEDSAEFAQELMRVLRDRRTYADMVSGTQRFAREHQWSDLLQPLLEFCNKPRGDTDKQWFGRSETAAPWSILNTLRRKLGT